MVALITFGYTILALAASLDSSALVTSIGEEYMPQAVSVRVEQLVGNVRIESLHGLNKEEPYPC